jgi:hypothetical protein
VLWMFSLTIVEFALEGATAQKDTITSATTPFTGARVLAYPQSLKSRAYSFLGLCMAPCMKMAPGSLTAGALLMSTSPVGEVVLRLPLTSQ